MTATAKACVVMAPVVGAFILSQFHRSAPAVLAPVMRAEYGLSPETLGLIAGAFHVAFALLQIPVGLLLDRVGPRRIVGSFSAMAALGAIVFALADTPVQMMIGQALIGVGCSPAFIGALVLGARWFAPDRFAAVSGVVVSVASTGILFSATPLAFVTEVYGWQAAYWGVAVLSVILMLGAFALTQDAPDGHDLHKRAPEPVGQVLAGQWAVLKTPLIWPIMALSFTAYPSLLTIRGLWGGPYMADMVGLSPIVAGNVLFCMTVAMAFSPGLYGLLAKRIAIRRLLLIGSFAAASVMAALALVSTPTLWSASALLVLHGLTGSYAVLVYAVAKAAFPDELVGRVLTTVNLGVFGGVFALQGLSAVIIGAYPTGSVQGYPIMFWTLAGFLTLAGVIYGCSRLQARQLG